MNEAIQTDYAGVQFRSRLEATWAAFFDLVGWPWEYEPIDLNGYIPDFVLTFSDPLLVEVKPALYYAHLHQHTNRIEESGWQHEALIVGAKVFDRYGEDPDEGLLGLLAERAEGGWAWAPAVFHHCIRCHQFSLFSSDYKWSCRTSGCYDGNSYHKTVDLEKARVLFNRAKGLTQWRAT